MLFVEYPPCSTCAKVRKWLEAQGADFTSRHIKENKPSYEELRRWHALSGLPLRRLFNTSGLMYRQLGLRGRLEDMSEEQQLRLLATDGMLVKRPILVTDSFALFGFDEAAWARALRGDR